METFFKENGKHLKPDYFVIGIIGAQSSGKSTLLNRLFGVDFEVMHNEVERKQTTRGIWTQTVPQNHFMILDIEGTDSRERWEEKQAYERRTALFGLAISNILLVNLWLNDIGRFGASNYDIIRTIFELNMQLFDHESPKKLIFVVRDWMVRENEDKIKNMLVNDMKRLWDSIKKTEAQSKIQFDNVFQFGFVHLRSLKYEPEGFEADVADFRDKLVDPANPANFFRGENFKNIPVDDFYRYMSQTWHTISENKDLNIPNQKVMISNYRCSEIKEESLVDYRQKVLALQQQAEFRPDFDISNELKELMNTSLEYFDTHTQNYDDKVARTVKATLQASLETDALVAFRPQNDKWIKASLESLERGLRRSASQTNVDVAKVLKLVVDERDGMRSRYRAFVGKYAIDPLKVSEFFNYFEIELNGVISRFLSSSTSTFCRKMVRGYVTEIDERISLTYMNLTRETWDGFNQFCEDILQKFADEADALRHKFADIKGIFTEETGEEFKKELVETIKTSLRSKKAFVFEYLIENFRTRFEIGANGQPHMWRHLTDGEINELFKKAKAEFAGALKLLDKPLMLDFDNEIVMTIDETLKLKKRFETETQGVLEEAFNKKYNRNAFQKIPKWMWFVLAYFMHDNVLEWMRNPVLFFFIVFFASGAGYLYFTNKIDYVLNWWQLLRSMAIHKIIEATVKGQPQGQAQGQTQGGSGGEPAKTGNPPASDRVSDLGGRTSDLTAGLTRDGSVGESI